MIDNEDQLEIQAPEIENPAPENPPKRKAGRPKPDIPEKHATEAESLQRQGEIIESLLMGMPLAKLYLFYSKKYNISQKQVANYTEKAREKIQQDGKARREELFNSAVARRLSNIYKINAQLEKKYDNATVRQLLKAENDLAKFLGFYLADGSSAMESQNIDTVDYIKIIHEISRRSIEEAANKKAAGNASEPTDVVT